MRVPIIKTHALGDKITFYRYKYTLCLSNTTRINYHRNYINNHSFINNQLAIVNTLKDLIIIKSGEQCGNELSLNNVNYLIHTLSTDYLISLLKLYIF